MAGRLLIFGGTTEGRELTQYGLPAVYCTATEYGAALAGDEKRVECRVGRMNGFEIARFIKENGIACAADATHPYAKEASENIAKACAETNTPLMRVGRAECAAADGVIRVKNAAAAADCLEGVSGCALLTTGSRDIEDFARPSLRGRLFARVLPSPDVIEKCAKLGFDAGHIIAMQGPFSLAMNEEMLRMTGAKWMVTKDGGDAGGIREKLDASENCGVRVIMIERPLEAAECHTVAETVLWARRLLGLSRPPLFPLLTDMEGRSAVIAGGGKVAARRAETLLRCGARVTAVSPEFCAAFDDLACDKKKKKWEPADFAGAVIAVAATSDSAVNRAAAAEAKKLGIPVSAADDAADCTFFFPSLINEGEAAASVSAGALSPALTHRLADRLRAVWPQWVAEERAANMNKGEKDS